MKRIIIFSLLAMLIAVAPVYAQKKRLSVPNTTAIKAVPSVQVTFVNLAEAKAIVRIGSKFECPCPAMMTDEIVKTISPKQGEEFIDKAANCEVVLLDADDKELRTFHLKGIVLRHGKAYKLTIYNDDLNLIENVIHR